MKMRLLGITWFPLIAYWSFLLALANSRTFNSSGFYTPFLIYIITSSIFIFLAQKEILRTKKDPISTISRINGILICFLISSIVILFNTLIAIDKSLWSTILIIIPLIINIFIYSLSDYQEEQLKKGYANRSQNRTDSLISIKEWEKNLLLLKEKYKEDLIISKEIERVENIINYSSFFRTEDSKDLLSQMKSTSNTEELLKLLKLVK